MITTMNEILNLLNDNGIAFEVVKTDGDTAGYWGTVLVRSDTSHPLPRGIVIEKASQLDSFKSSEDMLLVTYYDTALQKPERFREIIRLKKENDLKFCDSLMSRLLRYKKEENAKSEEVLYSLLFGKNLREIVEIISSVLGRSVCAVLDRNGIQYIFSGPNHEKTFSPEFYQSMYDDSLTAVRDIAAHNIKILKTLNEQQIPIFYSVEEEGFQNYDYMMSDSRREAAALKLGLTGKIIGSLILYENAKPFERKDDILLYMFARVISRYLGIPEFYNATTYSHNEQMINSLLFGENTALSSYLSSRLQLEHYQNIQVILFEGIKKDFYSSRFFYDFQEKVPQSVLTHLDDRIVALVNHKNTDTKQKVMEYIEKTAKKNLLRVFVSEEIHDIKSVKQAYKQTQLMKDHCPIQLKLEKTLVAFEDCKMILLFAMQKDSGLLNYFTIGDYEYLSRTDSLKNTGFLTTLTTYYLTGCSPSETCEKLHIHRNTLYYRFEKIEQLIHHDPTDIRFLSSLYLTDEYKKYCSK